MNDLDALVIGAMLSTSAVAVWTVAERIAQVSAQLAGRVILTPYSGVYMAEHNFAAADAFRQEQLVEAAFGQGGDDARRAPG